MSRSDKYREIIEQAEAAASVEASLEPAKQESEWRSDLVSSNGNKPDSKQCNYSLILAHDEKLVGRFRLDTFTHKITVQGELPFGSYEQPADFDEVMFTKLLGYLGSEYRIDDEKKTRRAVREAAAASSYDSLIEKLDSLVWDGTPRIETMLSILLGAEDCDYTREASKLLMRGAVCRAYATDGVQFDLMLVLVGDQGCRKTSFCRSLALAPGLFEDNLGELGKADAARKLQGALIVEMAELSAIKYTRQQEAVKAFITRIYDSYRLLYLEEVAKYPRRCVLIGTTNDHEFLSGSFWDRRYVPIECGVYETEFDWTDKEGVQRFFEQVWAEAIVWYKSDPQGIVKTLAPTPVMLEENRQRQNRFKVEHPWFASIEQYLSNNKGREVCAKELMVKALQIKLCDHNKDQSNYKKIHELMHGLFPDWERVDEKPKRLGEWGMQNVYYVHQSNTQQIEEEL